MVVTFAYALAVQLAEVGADGRLIFKQDARQPE